MKIISYGLMGVLGVMGAILLFPFLAILYIGARAWEVSLMP